MKRQRKLRFRGSAVLLIVGCFLGLLFVQQMFMNTTEAQQKTKKFNSVTDQLKGSTKAPADFQELEKGKKAPAKTEQRKPPTMKALMDKVSKQPGGKEKIKRATKKGKTSGMGSEMTGILLSGLSELNPFKLKVAHAASSLYLYPNYPYKKLSDTFYGWLYIHGALRGRFYTSSYYVKLWPSHSSTWGYDVRKPYVYLTVRVPYSGWYMINFETYYGAKATLKTRQSGSYPTVGTYDTRYTSGSYKDHPALLNLAAGTHYFVWILDQGYPYIFRVSVKKV